MDGEQIRMTPMGGVKGFNCRNCGGQVNLLAPGQTLAAACQHCGALADLTDDNFAILSKHRQSITYEPRYDIGSKAVFEGKTWVVIGMMVRIVRLYSFEWEEYLLFNPYHGFRFLSHAYGHWSWIKMIQDGPLGQRNSQYIRYNKDQYKFLTSGEAEVTFVLGEFYWQVKVGDVAVTRDLVAPPRMLSGELEDGGMIWSLCEYLEPSIVEAAFGGPPKNKIRRSGVGANQPNPYRSNFRKVLPVWIISMVVALGLFFVSGAMAPDKEVFSASYAYPDTLDKVSAPFDIPDRTNNVELEVWVESGLDNHWVEYSGVLHNLVTNENYEFTLGAEYYYGVTDGESWSEGGKSGSYLLTGIPPGKYEIVTSSLSDSVGTAKVSVVRGVPIYSSTLIVLILLSIVPVILIVRSKNFEKRRND
jgi:hypothetical protein